MHYTLTTIEQTDDGKIEEHRREPHSSLAALVRIAHRHDWLPGVKSGTGLTIVETVFRSVG